MAVLNKMLSLLLGMTVLAGSASAILLCGCSEKTHNNQPVTSNSIVDLLVEYNVGLQDVDEGGLYCAGTLFNTGMPEVGKVVLTASHCVLDDDTNLPVEYGLLKAGKAVLRWEVLRISRSQDLALLRITDELPVNIQFTTLSQAAPFRGQTVYLVGSPDGIEDVLSKGIVSIPSTESKWTGTHVTLLDIDGYYGSSGGGLFNEAGELLGVLIQRADRGGQFMYAVHLDEILLIIMGLN